MTTSATPPTRSDPNMTDATPRLLPAEENFLTDFFNLEEPLLIWLDQTTQDTRAGADDVYELPTGLDGEAARAAWTRIYDALPKALVDAWHALLTGKEQATGNKVIGLDGHEYTALYAAAVDPTDVEVLTTLLDHCRKALAREPGYTDLRSILSQAGEWYGDQAAGRDQYSVVPRVPETAEQVVNRLARALTVLQLHDDDTRTLLTAVTAAGPDRRIILTQDQEQAAHRYLDRVITAVTEGKPRTERAFARFIEFGDARPLRP
ncbi:hypothetical protein [Streptomyces achromogenes]|uniref:hypothetical protein n=1 Tax=Streptomyces achromogenes TaxID=67255 RepID=UPI00341EB9F3